MHAGLAMGHSALLVSVGYIHMYEVMMEGVAVMYNIQYNKLIVTMSVRSSSECTHKQNNQHTMTFLCTETTV